jgi:hypothetical protein
MDNMNVLEIKMLFRILNKNLRIGLTHKSFNFVTEPTE